MPASRKTLRRRIKAVHRNLRGALMMTRAMADTDHPLLAHIIPSPPLQSGVHLLQ